MVIDSIPSPPDVFLLPSLQPVSSASVNAHRRLAPRTTGAGLVVASGRGTKCCLTFGRALPSVGCPSLRPGQVLDLRILQTTPRLEALVLNNRLQEQLAVRLPALSQPFDWSGLLERLHRPEAQHLRPADRTLVHQLRQLLDPLQGRFAPLRERKSISWSRNYVPHCLRPEEVLRGPQRCTLLPGHCSTCCHGLS